MRSTPTQISNANNRILLRQNNHQFVASSLLVRILEECLTINSPPVLFFFFFKVEISLCTLIPLFMPGSVHSGSASSDDCGRLFPDKFCVSLFPDRFLYYAWTTAQSAHSYFVGSKVHVCLGVNLPSALLAE